MVARVWLHARQMSSSKIPHCLRFVGVGRRSYVDLSRELILSGSIWARVGQLSFLRSASSQHDQAHCLANPAAVADLLSSSMVRTSSMTISRRPLGPCAENQRCMLLPRPALLSCTAPTMSLVRRLASASVTPCSAVHFWPDFTTGCTSRITWSGESRSIMWRRTLPALNSSTTEESGGCTFAERLYSPTVLRLGGTPSHFLRHFLTCRWIASTRVNVTS